MLQSKSRVSDWTGGTDLGEFAQFVAGAAKHLNDSPGFRADIEEVMDVYGVGFLEALGVLFGRKKIEEARAETLSAVETRMADGAVVEAIMTKSSEAAFAAVNALMDSVQCPKKWFVFSVICGQDGASGFTVSFRPSAQKPAVAFAQGEFEPSSARKAVTDFVTDILMDHKMSQKSLSKYSK